MALKLNKTNQYIRLLDNGVVEIYPSQEDRNKQKVATHYTKILSKYEELMNEWDLKLKELIISYGYSEEALGDETLYEELIGLPGVDEICKELEKITDEEYLYSLDISRETGAKHEFPIMTKFFSDVKDSIPNLSGRVYISWDATTLPDIYAEAKAKHRFAETEDC